MNYSDIVEQTKKELMKHSDTAAILADMYARAKQSYENAYKASAEDITKDYEAKRNAASAQQKLNDKNTDELMAARGLAYSGESAQAKINSNIALANTLSSLARDHTEALTELKKEKDEKITDLDMEYGEKRIQADKALTDDAIKMAQDKIKYGEVTLDGEGGADGEGDGIFDPEMSANQLATNIVKRFGTGGKVQKAEENLNIYQYLRDLRERYSFTDEYLDKLTFALDALGYIGINADGLHVATVVNQGNLEYDKAYERAMSVAKKLYFDYDDRTNYAQKRAYMDRLDYIYTRCSTKTQFYAACRLLDLNSQEIDQYLRTVAARAGTPNQVDLGINYREE